MYAVINKFDINEAFTQTVEDYLEENEIPLLGKIPFSDLMVEAMIHEKTVVEYAPESDLAGIFQKLWINLQ